MAVIDIKICNSALIKIGASRISSINENNKAALFCKEQYTKLRDEVLSDHPWNFALKRVELAQVDDTPVFEYDYMYQLPSDCLRVLKSEYDNLIFKREGDKILSNESTMKIQYISSDVESSLYSPKFSEAFAFRMAADLAYALSNNATLAKEMKEAYDDWIADARSVDGQEGTPDNLVIDDWTNARF